MVKETYHYFCTFKPQPASITCCVQVISLDRNYELNALERHHNVVNTSGELGIFFKPRSVVGGVYSEKRSFNVC